MGDKKMRAPGKFFAIGLVVGIFLISIFSFCSLESVAAAVSDNGQIDVVPNSFTVLLGQTGHFAYEYNGQENEMGLLVYIKYTHIPSGIQQVSFNENGVGNWNLLMFISNGKNITSVPGWVIVSPYAVPILPLTVEFDIWIVSPLSYPPYSKILHKTFTVVPLPIKEWDITYYPNYTSLYKNENVTYTITIQNNLNLPVAWDISTDYIGTGFSVSPSSGSISVPANSSLSWTTKITATGEGLYQNNVYKAASFSAYNRYRSQTVSAGFISIMYLSTSEEFNDFQVWTDPEYSATVEADAWENIDIYIKNLSDGDRDYNIVSAVALPWFFSYPTPTSDTILSLGPGENGKWGSVAVKPNQPNVNSHLIIIMTDNLGLKKTKTDLRLIWSEGSFTSQVNPEYVEMRQGQSVNVQVTVKNNESENRSYAIAWMLVDVRYLIITPPASILDNMGANTYATKNFNLFMPSSAVEDYTVNLVGTVTCVQTGTYHRIGIQCVLKPGVGGQYEPTGGFSGLITLFLPFTGGDAIMAGYMVGAFIIIVPLVVMGLAVVAAASRRGKTGQGGLVILSFYMLGLLITTVGGLFPMWFLVFHIAILALILARGWITYKE